LDVFKLEPKSDTEESDQFPALEHVELAVPKTSPLLKSEKMVCFFHISVLKLVTAELIFICYIILFLC
jgi:hypothetical protein